jgi:hypothetical protein
MHEPEVIERIQKAINEENVTGIMVATLDNGEPLSSQISRFRDYFR